MLIEKRGFFTNILTVLPYLESTSSPFSALHQLERKIILAACIPDRVTEGGGGFSTARIFPSGTSKCVGDKSSLVKPHQAFKMDESERELLFRSRQERRAIVAKYDKGREPGAEIDDWEDPKNELYHSQDRFGFIQ